jgi:hypothetical protein
MGHILEDRILEKVIENIDMKLFVSLIKEFSCPKVCSPLWYKNELILKSS